MVESSKIVKPRDRKKAMGGYEFTRKAKLLVARYIYDAADKNKDVPLFDIYMLSYSRVNDAHIMVLSTSLSENIVYVVTYDSNKNELIFDVYPKKEYIVYDEDLSLLRGEIC